jgi:hypothetical protein
LFGSLLIEQQGGSLFSWAESLSLSVFASGIGTQLRKVLTFKLFTIHV